jgi:predicted component of type VI protein secretion system
LPDSVQKDREQAWRAHLAGIYKGAALLARSALEASAKLLEAQGKDLKARIHWLAGEGVITQKLAEWADEVRITGNEAAHEMEEVTEEDAEAALYFLDSFLEDVFVVPYRHEQRKRVRAERERGID